MQELQLSEYEALLASAQLGFVVFRKQRLVWANACFAAMLGYPPDTLIGMPPSAFLADAPASLPPHADLALRHRDGSPVCCTLRQQMLDAAQTGVSSLVWAVEDRRERHQLSQRMETLLLEQKAVLDNASVGVALFQEEKIRHCNPHFAKIFGWSIEALQGQPAHIIHISRENWLRLRSALGAQLLRGEVAEMELPMMRRDGAHFVSVARGKLIATGRPELGSVWIVEDVTLKRALERKLQQAHEELELRVQERTSDLQRANARLEQEARERLVIENRVTHLAYHDPLTGLPNRLLLEDRVQHALHMAERRGTSFALAFIDLDDFKLINDSLGHEAGDELLKTIARRMHRCIRATDTLSRQGGDEFLLVFNELEHMDELHPLLERIMACIREPVYIQGQQISISASIGIACYPCDGRDFLDLRRKADVAMYSAKIANSNSYRFFSAELDAKTHGKLRLRDGLSKAIARNELELYYQPQFNLQTGQVIGAEALLRWNSAELGAVSPAVFIPVAEESGLIVDIGAWVLRQACQQAVRWHASGFGELQVAVNCSAEQFRRADMYTLVCNALRSTELRPGALELELTESTLIHSAENMQDCIKRLKALGVRISIDDFGTGYSSLSYLRQLAVDKLKIDKSFVRDMDTDMDNAALCKAIIQMAQSLGLKTIAEGIETAEVALALQAMGCEAVQGYHYARPMPADALSSFLGEYARPRLA